MDERVFPGRRMRRGVFALVGTSVLALSLSLQLALRQSNADEPTRKDVVKSLETAGLRVTQTCNDGNAFVVCGVGATTYSATCRHSGYIPSDQPKGRVHYRIDGLNGPDFDEVRGLQFSPDERVSSYVGCRGKKEVLLVTPKEIAEHDKILGLCWVPEGSSMAYASEDDGKCFVHEESRVLGPFRSVDNLVFGGDGKTLAFISHSEDDGKCFVHEGSHVLGPFRSVDNLVFSRDGKTLAFISHEEDRHASIIVRGNPTAVDPEVYRILLSEDGQGWVALTHRDGKHVVIWNGSESEPLDNIGEVSLSEDGKHLAYSAYRGQSSVVFKDQKEYSKADHAYGVVLSRDGARIAWFEGQGPARIVVDGKPGEWEKAVWIPFFSRNGKSMAYIAGSEGDQHMVVNGVRGPRFEYIFQHMFDPDDSTVVYAAVVSRPAGGGIRMVVVWGDVRSPEVPDLVQGPKFDADGKGLHFGIPGLWVQWLRPLNQQK